MSDDNAERIEELKNKIKERKELLAKFINFAEEITRERGQIVERDEGSSHTRIVRRLVNFAHFSFETATSYCDNVKILYHPDVSEMNVSFVGERNLARLNHAKIPPVLDVYYQTEGDYAVRIFDEDTGWQAALKDVVEHKDELIKKMDEKNAEDAEGLARRHQESETKRELEKLEKEAAKLKIS